MNVNTQSLRSFRWLVVITIASILLGCGATATQAPVSESTSLDTSFPLSPISPATTASALSQSTAIALGRGINLGNMFESPLANGDWGVMLMALG
jgi:hypothetical protein